MHSALGSPNFYTQLSSYFLGVLGAANRGQTIGKELFGKIKAFGRWTQREQQTVARGLHIFLSTTVCRSNMGVFVKHLVG